MKWIALVALLMIANLGTAQAPGEVRIEIVGCTGYWGYDKPNETLIFYCRHKT